MCPIACPFSRGGPHFHFMDRPRLVCPSTCPGPSAASPCTLVEIIRMDKKYLLGKPSESLLCIVLGTRKSLVGAESIFKFLRIYHTVFQSSQTISHSPNRAQGPQPDLLILPTLVTSLHSSSSLSLPSSCSSSSSLPLPPSCMLRWCLLWF